MTVLPAARHSRTGLGQAFWRGERADVRTQDGTGLGLAIAHDIIRRLGGRWEVRSRPEFPGLELVWRLPLLLQGPGGA